MIIHLSVRKELHRLWLTHYFRSTPDGAVRVTRDTDLGKLICSTVKYSNLPHSEELPLGHLVRFQLPHADSLRLAPGRFLFFDRETQLRLNDLIEVFFNLDFDRFYLQGVKLGMVKKDVIESFIVSRKLSNLLGDNEMLKKRQYREELQLFGERVEQLRQRAYYRNDKIEIHLQKNLIN